MMIVPADRDLSSMWPDLWPLLEPATRRCAERPDVLGELRAHVAQLWAVHENGRAVAAVVTRVQDVDGERRCLFWLIGGTRAREWGADLVRAVAEWSHGIGCVALWGVGRRGWAPIVAALGFERIADFEGQPAWLRRIQ